MTAIGAIAASRRRTGGGPVQQTGWRLANWYSTSQYSGCSEIEMRATADGPDLCAGGTALASSQYSSAYAAAKAFDDDTATLWCDNGIQPAWIEYDFAAPVTIVQVAIRARTDGENAIAPDRFDVQYWTGSAWVTSWSVSGQGSWSTGEQRLFTKP